MKNRIYLALFFIIWLSAAVLPQTGGSYDLSHAVVASGGGSGSSGGSFRVDGTAGQTSAGTVSSGGTNNLRGGFWAFPQFAPTSAAVIIGGRVTTANGQGIRNVRVQLTDANGATRTIQTSSFGYYRFEGVEVGQIYILQISSKRFTFANPTRILNVQEEITDADFIAEL